MIALSIHVDLEMPSNAAAAETLACVATSSFTDADTSLRSGLDADLPR